MSAIAEAPAFTIVCVDAATVRQRLTADQLAQLDALGGRSGVAQQLTGPITTVEKLEASTHTLLLCCSTGTTTISQQPVGQCLGFIKYGTKDLYFYRKNGQVTQCSPVCLLDFYVDEAVQRGGIGIALFREMMAAAGTSDPRVIAYDRPSPKLLAFLRKHFGLVSPDLQPNRYAIYDGFPLG
jgi:alpha-tubulin N-acetyltransferase 1